MKKYEVLDMEVIRFAAEDVITASGAANDGYTVAPENPWADEV